MIPCREVAKYLLSLADDDAGDLISNLKLQKLVYYAQGFHLAMYNEPLFPEDIYAWTHGPVVPELYREYRQYGPGSIPVPTDLDPAIYDERTGKLLDEVYGVYGQFSAWKLRSMTHEEPPWQEASHTNGIIQHDSMRNYFQQFIVNQ